jgi:hypothetical protein
MAKEQLLVLIADVERLLVAGAFAASDNEMLRRHAQTLREMGRQVPALATLAEAMTGVVSTGPERITSAFLDLLLLTRQLRFGLGNPQAVGSLQALSGDDHWQTPCSLGELFALREALTQRKEDREARLRDAHSRGAAADLRLLPTLISTLYDSDDAVADFVADQVLPAMGRCSVPGLAEPIAPRGNAGDARRLRLLARFDPAAASELCRQIFQAGNNLMRLTALRCLTEVGSAADAEAAGLALCKVVRRDIRGAALQALRHGCRDESLDRLLEALTDLDDDICLCAADSLAVLPHPQTTRRLLRRLASLLDDLVDPRRQPLGIGNRENRGGMLPPRVVAHIVQVLHILAERRDNEREDAIRALRALLSRPEREVREAARLALVRAESDGPPSKFVGADSTPDAVERRA